MIVTRATLGLAVVALMLMSSGALAPQDRVERHELLNTSMALARAGDEVVVTVPDPLDDDQGRLDLNGNDVTDAVATYRLNADGSLYEAHSPQTDLPKLGPPKS